MDEPKQEIIKQPPDMVPGELTPRLSRNRSFNIFWLGQTFSALGDSFSQIALPLLVLEATGSVAQMGLVTATVGIGQIVSGLFAGSLVDTLDRRKLMIFCDIARALLISLIPLCWFTIGPQIWLLYIVTGLGSLLGNLFGIANITAVANLVERDQILDANARFQASGGVAFFVGPMLAGLVSHQFGGPAVAVGVNALTFLISFVSLLFVRLRPSLSLPRPKQSRWQELSLGLRFLWQQPVLRAITILFGLGNLLNFAGLDLFVYRLKHDLGQNDNTVGIVLGIASIGAIISALLAPLFRRRLGFGLSFIGASVVQGVALASIGLAPTALLIVPAVVGYVFSDRVRGINSLTLRQQITPDYMLGRVTAVFWTLIQVTGPLGAALTTAFAGQYGASLMLLIMGVAGLALAVAAIFSPINQRSPEQGLNGY